jgi:protein-L-isoaspartate(D-aspartate) O-methyltransferase
VLGATNTYKSGVLSGGRRPPKAGNIHECSGPMPMNYAAARRTMVENQIRTNRVRDPLLVNAMSELPRELFVPERLRGIAYADEDIPLGNGRSLIEPLVAALLLQTAQIRGDDVVLTVGCGTGYLAALAAPIASAVVALEDDPDVAAKAGSVLSELGMNTVAVVEGPLDEGYAKQAPYDVIIFGGAVTAVPGAVAAQLAENGRMVAVTRKGTRDAGRGTLYIKAGGALSSREVFDASIPFLPGFEPQESFTF